MDYPCRKCGDCSFSRFGSIVRTNVHTDTHTRTQTDAVERFTPATVVGVSNNSICNITLHSYFTQHKVTILLAIHTILQGASK